MACTIQELISQCVFPDLNLIAGQNGIGNVVTAINYKDVFDGAEDFRPGELLFTSGYGLRDEGTLSSLITMLCQCDTRGLVVQTGRYVEHIPQKLIDEADRLGFPLLTLPIRIPFSDIVQTLAPLLSPQGDQTWKTAALKQAHVFLEEVLRSDGHMFSPSPAIRSCGSCSWSREITPARRRRSGMNALPKFCPFCRPTVTFAGGASCREISMCFWWPILPNIPPPSYTACT